MMRIQSNNRGDTIVEVLISLAVLSMVIGGAYSIVNAALRNSRQAQERAEATKLAESQVETIKAGVTGVTAGSPFCLAGTNAAVTWSASVPPASYIADTFAGYPAACTGRNSGFHNVFIVKQGSTYTINVRWDRIGGGKEQLQMVYRSYE